MNQRQQSILTAVIGEYVNNAAPVGSRLLVEKYDLNLSPATVRMEMVDLARKGFLFQPHTSAGRVPTSKGYRFFVDFLMGDPILSFNDEKKIIKEIKEMGKKSKKTLRNIAKILSSESSSLAITILSEECCKIGISQLLEKSEFRGNINTLEVFRILDDFEDYILKLKGSFHSDLSPAVYIGDENPISELSDLSTIIAGCNGGFLAIVGPQRMDYARNISLINLAGELLLDSH